MDWLNLLSPHRLGTSDAKLHGQSRTGFERDYDRILFSNAFRRLHDKTQVFPMPSNDHIHSRLTHSLEVASVGRSLGRWAGETIVSRHRLESHGYHHRDVGDIVSSACLAHDIGNPPFGHSGEDAIARWFRVRFADPAALERAAPELASLSPAERRDLEYFEGNAQGFRVLTRLAMYPDAGGMRLTAATLGTFTKYPRQSLAGRAPGAAAAPLGVSLKKHGFFQADRESFAQLAGGLGLRQHGDHVWCRHPLAFLVEAADDICYSILDLEDGFTLKKITFAEVAELLGEIAARLPGAEPGGEPSPWPTGEVRGPLRDRVSFLRARAIRQLVGEAVMAFNDNEGEMLAGRFDRSLVELIPSAQSIVRIKEVAEERCYNAPDVVQVLLAGYSVIGRLLDELLPAVLQRRDQRDEKLVSLLPAEVRQEGSPYEKTLRVTDYVAGMTDRFAMNLYRNIFAVTLAR